MTSIREDYFNWLCTFIDEDDLVESFSMALSKLFDTDFYSLMPMDENREFDGLKLRERYAEYIFVNYEDIQDEMLSPKCSVLEMMIALAIRFEEDILYSEEYGDRTSVWFWDMFNNMDLDTMPNDSYDEEEAEYYISRMLDRAYDRDGKGGLFRIKDVTKNMTTTDIWYQMCFYLREISYGEKEI